MPTYTFTNSTHSPKHPTFPIVDFKLYTKPPIIQACQRFASNIYIEGFTRIIVDF
jgi:hypothetical protein